LDFFRSKFPKVTFLWAKTQKIGPGVEVQEKHCFVSAIIQSESNYKSTILDEEILVLNVIFLRTNVGSYIVIIQQRSLYYLVFIVNMDEKYHSQKIFDGANTL
jgi:hypothetical protein